MSKTQIGLALILFIALVLSGVVVYKKSISSISPSPAPTTEGEFCGGIAGIHCPTGYYCQLDGNYPDASGICVIKSPKIQKNCIVTGCNREICADEELASICVYKPEYDCYKGAICERQRDGKCGWRKTSELISCLGNSVGKNDEELY